MNIFRMLLLGVAALPVCLRASEITDSLPSDSPLTLGEVVVTAKRSPLRQTADRITYIAKNDPFASGLNGIEVLDRIPRITVTGDDVNVVGKQSVKYIVDGQLMDMPDEAIASFLKNLQASGIDKIELLTSPPAKYSGNPDVGYISITTRNETLGTRGNVWGKGTLSDQFKYQAGGNISHSTRKIELSADASYMSLPHINDYDRTYIFVDHVRTSRRRNSGPFRMPTANAMFRYKFTPKLSAGAIINFSSIYSAGKMTDATEDADRSYLSTVSVHPHYNNALTLTAFSDYAIDSKGKTLSLTYNYFTRHASEFADVLTEQPDASPQSLTKDAANRHQIHSVKFDATLPFSLFRLDAGAAYTAIGNNTDLIINNKVGSDWVYDSTQSNAFSYSEKTAAIYAGAERNFLSNLFGKISLRYEHTDVSGLQQVGNRRNRQSYGRLLPSATLSYSSPFGRFTAQYSAGINRPIFGDLNPFRYYTTVYDYFTGNPDLASSTLHNAEINYSYRGIYAVLYNSYNKNTVGYVTRFDTDGIQSTTPENCLDTEKAGLYASYFRTLLPWWNLQVGGEVFYTHVKSNSPDFMNTSEDGWSGKLEVNTTWMLNRPKTLVLNLRCSHYFPRQEGMARYDSYTLLSGELRDALLDGRLNLTLSVSDPFGWNVSKSTTRFANYTLVTRSDIHSHSVGLRAAWSFGRSKVINVYRSTKESESYRSN